MSSKWTYFRLIEICTKIGSGATPTGGKSTYTDFGEYALIRSQNVLDFVFSYNGLAYINKKQATKLNNVAIEKNDVLINITGDSVARVCMVPENVLPARVNQHVSILRVNPSLFSAKLLKYLLLSNDNKDKLLSLASSGATRNALTKSMLENFVVYAPKDPVDQEKLAQNLQSLDDKIANNNRINQTLEEMAQALFKSWFVDFEPVKAKMQAIAQGNDPQIAAMEVISGKTAEETQNFADVKYDELRTTADLFPDSLVESELGLIPEGWSVGSIGDVYPSFGGYAFKSKDFKEEGYPVIKIKNIGEDGRVNLIDTQKISPELVIDKERFRLQDGDILMAMTGATIGKVGIVVNGENPSFLNQRVAKFGSVSKIKSGNWFAYQFFKLEENRSLIISSSQGSAQPNISTTGIDSLKTTIDNFELINRFNTKVDILFRIWINNEKECRKLSELRDSLLPKLLSGNIFTFNSIDNA
ncbi:type I restriction enzyme S subunit [Ancylomarina subtilis]|uniref:Type I restriction enzyme S subunit n=1 Tax=Ancylomarina subtilis TaxID=1639035 RepID=A0A4Q7V9W2_9BACT|nr:restriction endonuclease subunit S [Ancylomarina subtilis]RZT93576.1 type I restriction enzyme S subunit [Ancylomarina subtilis]